MAVVFPIFAVLFIYWALSSRRASRASLAGQAVSGSVPGTSSAGASAARAVGSGSSPPVPAPPSTQPTATQPTATQPTATPAAEPSDEGDVLGTGPSGLRYLLEADRAALVKHAEIRRYRACELVVREGDEAFGLCILLSGRVGLLVEAGSGRHVLVDTVRPGELFAWSGAVPPFHYTATGHAMVDSEVAVLGKVELESLCEADPVLGYHLMREITVVMGRRVRDLEAQLVGLS
jgi:CRP-like cAMP-binding protein